MAEAISINPPISNHHAVFFHGDSYNSDPTMSGRRKSHLLLTYSFLFNHPAEESLSPPDSEPVLPFPHETFLLAPACGPYRPGKDTCEGNVVHRYHSPNSHYYSPAQFDWHRTVDQSVHVWLVLPRGIYIPSPGPPISGVTTKFQVLGRFRNWCVLLYPPHGTSIPISNAKFQS
ncbi:uncharacterized protein LY89DRAFT_714346 [Mollisia scopiformis]|uniref:Uncharacterized protein n=1 Tax=Mollisia scopiformis TaxID=149040 RepID=A0A194XS72_MOLSC|nr:uncharacterized protein LY89DRAFT_714346 [Mollisia scopiformis]KUJ22577.1 hypothetical protein LY89DRAFT_714346 [Mollisia scopiformis]